MRQPQCATCRYWFMIEPSEPYPPPAKPEFAPRLPRLGLCKARDDQELITSRYGKCEGYKPWD